MKSLVLIRLILLALSFIFVIIGISTINYNIILVGILVLFIHNMLFCLEKINERIILMIFYGTFFLFLLGRPFVGMMRGDEWWDLGTYSRGINFALTVVTAGLFFTYLGAEIVAHKVHDSYIVVKSQSLSRPAYNRCLQTVSLIVFSFAILASFYEGYQKLEFMGKNSYLDFYTSYNATRPLIINGFIQFMRPSLCIYLATMPRKKSAFTVLFLYFISTLPSLRVGMRSPTMLACVFIFVYCFLRDDYIVKTERRWIGTKEKLAIILLLPPAIVFLLLYVRLRNGQSINTEELSNPIFSFLYQQGISFDVLAQSYVVLPRIWNRGFPGFMLGPVIDNVRQSFLIRVPFQLSIYKAYTPEFLEHSHDLKAILSYLIMGDKYFQGHGVGTSYLLDAYADLNWLGVITINIILGVLLLYLVIGFRKHWILRSSIIYSLLTLFYMPRSNLMECVVQLFSPYFWICLLVCYLGALLFYHKYFVCFVRRKDRRLIS